MSFLTSLLESHGAQAGEGLANHLGVPKEKAVGLLAQLGPMILGAVKSQAADDDEKVDALLDEHGDEGAVDDAAGFFGGDGGGELAGKAESLLGSDMAKKAIAVICDKLGVSSEQAELILPKVISFVLGALNKQKKEAGGGSAGMDMVKGFLDKDGDGSVMDDLGGLLGGGGDDEDGGGLGGLVGGFLGGNK